MLPMQLSNTHAGAERSEWAFHLLEMVDMADQAHKFPSAVSGGQQQRAAIARALANDPKVLVADEPTGSLDSKTSDSIFQLFEAFVDQGRTILMVTHDRDLASRVSRVILIADGEITDQYISKALRNLSQKELVQVSSKLDPVTYAPSSIVFKQGDPADKFYIVIKGQVEVVVEHESGQEVVSATLSSGQFFGEMGLLQGGARTATIRVVSDAEAVLMALDRDTFSQLISKSDLTQDAIAKLMRQRITADRMLTRLSELDNTQMSELESGSERLIFNPGAVIIRQGEVGDKFYFITKGEVEVVKETDEGELALARLSSGQYFGEIELIYDRPRSATVRAAQDTEQGVEVIAIGKAAFYKLRTMFDETSEDIMSIADSRRLATKMVDFGFMPDEN
jgi:sulfate-transporting ATPase